MCRLERKTASRTIPWVAMRARVWRERRWRRSFLFSIFRLPYFFFVSFSTTRSSAYRMPLPLYGSGGRTARTSAAIWPTLWRSAPLITISVGVGHSTLIPAGISMTTGCENPICRLSLAPCACARYPTPTSVSFFSKPLLTPVTMFASSARIVPLIAFAAWLSSAGASFRLAPSRSIVTNACTARASVPLVPLTVICSAVTSTSTPAGTVIGIFPMRDIVFSPRRARSGDVAQHFAADTRGARLAVGHNALGRGHDRHAEAVLHLRNRVAALVDAQPRAADALDALDHRPAGVVLERDLEFGLRTLAPDREPVDVALVLQDLGDRDLHLRRGHRQ